jgi:biopolymer transport protein ExbD
MEFYDMESNVPKRPEIMVIPLIDIVFISLIFFMITSLFYEKETEIDISVPTTSENTSNRRSYGDIIINVTKEGSVIVNQKKMSHEELGSMLKKLSKVSKGQSVIIRGDKNSLHKHIVKVLDLCAGADIWNVAFATMPEENEKK